MWWWILASCASNPCVDLSQADCRAADECVVTDARGCDGLLVFGGCALRPEKVGCSELRFLPHRHDGECKLYSEGDGCVPQELERCDDPCFDTG